MVVQVISSSMMFRYLWIFTRQADKARDWSLLLVGLTNARKIRVPNAMQMTDMA
jgi:hypothetical protein